MQQVGTDGKPEHPSADEEEGLRNDTPRLRLLFALPFAPARDLMHGGRVVSQLLLRLAERHRIALVYLQNPDAPPIDPGLAERCEPVTRVPRAGPASESAWRRRLHVAAAPLAGTPSPVPPMRDDRYARACVDTARRWEPDVVQVEHDTMAYLGPLLKGGAPGPARILTCHDPGVLSSRDQARAARGRQRIAHRLDTYGWKRYWSRTLPAFDAIVTLTDRDRDVLEASVQGPRLVSIPLGIDIPEQPLSAEGVGEPSVAFVGGYSHPPNLDAALRLARSIMPAVRRELPGLPLTLVGADPGQELLDAAGPHDTVTGTVPTVTPFVNDAALLALPIRLAGGMRVKLLEALAGGKAVVASPIAASGLDVISGEQLILAETDEEFVASIVALARDRDARRRIGRNARAWAQENLGWGACVRRYERLYETLLTRQAR